MALGHSDTDAFYERLVAPVLRRNGVTPIVINRTLGNDDLNSQIIKQLTEADFTICDLTYARPSVYFEAGFAQRTVPVVYTVRKDHLQLGQPDDRRVHFDLQMKPLITWVDPSDADFASRLERRLRGSVLRSLGRDRAVIEGVTNARNEFARHPVAQRLVDMRQITIKALGAAAFDMWREVAPFGLDRTETVLAGGLNHVAGTRVAGGTKTVTTVSAYDGLTSSALKDLAQSFMSLRTMSASALGSADGEIGDIRHFVLSLRALPRSRIESALPMLAPRADGKTYDDTSRRFEVPARWHFLAPVLSEAELVRAVSLFV
jgi:hypothetical protein